MADKQIGRKFGEGHNISREGHIGGLIDGSPELTGITTPSLSVDTTQKAGVPTNANHYSKFMFKNAITMKANSANPNGWFERSGDGDIVDGQLIAVTSDTDGRGTVAQQGFNMEFPVADATTLDHTVIGQRILGAGDGNVKPVAEPTALDPSTTNDPTDAELASYHTSLLNYMKGRGRITNFDNTTGAKKVLVTLWVSA